MDPKTLEQARAMITWGESPEAVSCFLLSNDVSTREAEECLALLKAERQRELRKTGIRKLLIGVVLVGVSASGLAWFWEAIETGIGRRRGGVGSGVLALLLLGLFFGIGKLVDGLIYLIRPQLESKAISEISD